MRKAAKSAGKHAGTAKDYAQDCRESLRQGDTEAALDLALCAMASARASSRFAEQCIKLGDPSDMTSIELAVSVAAQALAYAVETLEAVLLEENERMRARSPLDVVGDLSSDGHGPVRPTRHERLVAEATRPRYPEHKGAQHKPDCACYSCTGGPPDALHGLGCRCRRCE